MGDILFLSQRIPWPPDKGDKIRSWRALKHLARTRKVHLATFIDDPDDERHIRVMEDICESVHVARLHPAAARLKSLRALATGQPLTLPYFYDKDLAAFAATTAATKDLDAIFVFSSAMAQYALNLPPHRLLMDFVDVDSEKFRQYAHEGNLVSKWVYGREARKLLTFDTRVAQAADASFFVSEAEADIFRRLSPEVAAKVFALSNGIDTQYFDPAAVTTPKADLPEFGPGPNIVFTGRMDYKPNIDAVIWFAQKVLPALLEANPQTRFIIAGAAPTSQVKTLGQNSAVKITGRVADMRPFMAHADLAVAPMAIGRGIQNKVLEAAAMARPVLTTSQGLEGIDLIPDTHLFVANGTPDFTAACLDILVNPQAADIGQAARQRLVSHYGWTARMSALDAFLP